jgi:hypothetical protein
LDVKGNLSNSSNRGLDLNGDFMDLSGDFSGDFRNLGGDFIGDFVDLGVDF